MPIAVEIERGVIAYRCVIDCTRAGWGNYVSEEPPKSHRAPGGHGQGHDRGRQGAGRQNPCDVRLLGRREGNFEGSGARGALAARRAQEAPPRRLGPPIESYAVYDPGTVQTKLSKRHRLGCGQRLQTVIDYSVSALAAT
jgi:hypothetical protein